MAILNISWKTFLHVLLIAFVGIVVYSNTFDSPFIWDDSWIIVENSRIKDLANFTDCSGTRYLTFLSFAVNYKLNSLNVTGYHIFNIAVHILNALLIYLLISVIFRTPYFSPPFNSPLTKTKGGVMGGVPLTKGGYRGVALFSGLIFVSHPVYTMAVTNINQRSILLATFFYLLSLVTYIKWRLRDNSLIPKNRSGVSPDRQDVEFHLRPQAGSLTYNNEPSSLKIGQASRLTKRYTPYAISLISAILAMKCKEVAITLPVIILLFERFFFGDKWKKSLIYTIPILLTLIIIPISKPQEDVFNLSRTASFKIKDGSILSGLNATKLSHIPRQDYMLTELSVMLTYIRLFFLPFNLNFDYDYPIYKSLLEPNVILPSLFIVFLFALALYIYFRSGRLPRNSHPPFNSPLAKGGVVGGVPITKGAHREATFNLRLISFGILWFFINLLIESFVVILNYVIFEYRLYLASIGIILLLAGSSGYVIINLRKKLGYISGAIILIVIIFSTAAYTRNELFEDELTFWEDVVKKSPLKAKVHNNLGVLYYEQGRTSKALQEYKIALTLNPDDSHAYNNLGNAYLFAGLVDNAIIYFQSALKLNPDFAEAHNNLGLAYKKKGLINEAVQEFQAALMIQPDFIQARQSLESLKRKKQ